LNPRLVILTGPESGNSIPLTTEKTMVGRSESCDIRPMDAEVSRKHCSIEMKDDRYWVFDLMSLNGTFVNDTRVQSKHVLNDGDELRLAFFSMRFRMKEEEEIPIPDGTTKNLEG
jgi:pSer/pThr/pTyr-binding forkhead associated (FHA) protein